MAAKMPFFMRFVERQDKNTEQPQEGLRTGVKAGAENKNDLRKLLRDKQPETMKYPSDGDEELGW